MPSRGEISAGVAAVASVNPAEFVDGDFGLPTVADIVAELQKPGRDPRPRFETATFTDGIEKITDLRPGMILEGTVSNVAAFGAFVDIGVHQDGLVHVSAMSNSFVSDPHTVVKSGQVVRVKVLEVEPERKRISLTLRLDDEARFANDAGSAAVPRPTGRHARTPATRRADCGRCPGCPPDWQAGRRQGQGQSRPGTGRRPSGTSVDAPAVGKHRHGRGLAPRGTREVAKTALLPRDWTDNAALKIQSGIICPVTGG